MEFSHLSNNDTLGFHHFIEKPFKEVANCGPRVVSVVTAFNTMTFKTNSRHGNCEGEIKLKVSKEGVDDFSAYFEHDRLTCKHWRARAVWKKEISKEETKGEKEGDGGAEFRQRCRAVMKEAYDEINENYLKEKKTPQGQKYVVEGGFADLEEEVMYVVADTNYPLLYAAERVEMINTVITFLNERADANIDVGSVQDKSRGPDSEAAGKGQTRDSRYELWSRSGRSSKNRNTALPGKNEELPNSNPSEEGPSNRGQKTGGRFRFGFGIFQNR